MIRISILLAAAIFYLSGFGLAAIINIPADYPAIQEGIDATTDGDTVLVQPGIYYENINFNGHNIVLGSLFFTTGDTSYISTTIIDGNSSGRPIQFISGEDNRAVVAGFTIRNGRSGNGGGIYCSMSSPEIHDNKIINNETYGFGGGAYCDELSAVSFRKNVVAGNWADWGGGGLYIENCQALIMQNVISGNGSVAYGGGILCNYNANPQIINSTFNGNSAYFGGGICYLDSCYPQITNSILWGDSAFESGAEFFGDGTSIPIYTYCDVQNAVFPGPGNIDIDPLYRDPDNGDFHLMSIACGDSVDSPCIDAGDPNILDSLLDCSWGLGGLRSDMGAYGGWDSATVGISEYDLRLPNKIALMQNYPNPFNSSTTIEFMLPASSQVSLNVYDLLGRKVRVLAEDYMNSGIHKVIFNASGMAGGVYFSRMQTENNAAVGKMILLK